jgi:hypothetical protein
MWSSRCWPAANGLEAEAAGGAVPRGAPQRALEIELTRRNIPFVKFGGLKFLEAPRQGRAGHPALAENPRDRIAGFRACSCCPPGPPARRVLDAMQDAPDRSPP